MNVGTSTGSLYTRLRELVAQGRSGRLRVIHWLGREGVVGLNEGKIVHCQVGRLRGREALEFLSNWMSVSLEFYENVESLSMDLDEDTTEILSFLERREEEFNKVRALVPGPESVFALSPEAQNGRVTVNGRLWKVLALVNGRNSVRDICVNLRANEFSVSRVLAHLASRRMIRLVATQRPLAPQLIHAFMETLEENLADHIGPIAPVMIQDTLEEMGKEADYLTGEDLPLVVERLSGLIEDEPKRVEFQGKMLALLKQTLSQRPTA